MKWRQSDDLHPKNELENKNTPTTQEALRGQNDTLLKVHYKQDENMTIIQRVSNVAEKRSLPMAQVALAWMLFEQAVTFPIIGFS